MLRTDDIIGARPNKFIHRQKGHVQPIDPTEGQNREIVIRPGRAMRPKGGLNAPFAIDGNFNMPSTDVTRTLKRNASTQNRNSMNLHEFERPIINGNEQNYNHNLINEKDLYNNRRYEDDGNQYRNEANGLRTPSYGKSLHKSTSSLPKYKPATNLDSLDILTKEVSDKSSHTPTPSSSNSIQLKKALHNFYGVTPPPTGSSNYHGIKVLKHKEEPLNQFSDSFYQNLSKDNFEKASKNTGFNIALKEFYGVPLSETDAYKRNMNRFYGSNTPIGQAFKFSGGGQDNVYEKQQEQALQQQQMQYQESLKNLNKSTEDLPYYLDPISHQRVYRTNGLKR